MKKNNTSKSKQFENLFNSLTEDIFNTNEAEIDEMLTELGYDPKKVGDAGVQLVKNLQKLKEAKGSTGIKLRPVAVKEIGKEYYWRRTLWRPVYSGMVVIAGDGGSNRDKGWQVKYVDNEKEEIAQKVVKLA